MLGKTLADLRTLTEDVRTDADRHVERLTDSLERSSELLTVTLFAVGLLAGVALLIAVLGISGD